MTPVTVTAEDVRKWGEFIFSLHTSTPRSYNPPNTLLSQGGQNVPDHALAGITVLDLSSFVAGPYSTKLMAMMGARVIKIEPPGRGDVSRWTGPFLNDEPHPERSGLFAHLNTGKQSVALDIATAEGAEGCRRIACHCDAVIEDFPPGLLHEYGLNYDRLCQGNPSIVVASLTPYGQDGPYRRLPSTSLTVFAMGGQMSMTGEPDRAPLRPYGYQADYQLGLNGFAATLTAIYGAQLSGVGQHVDVSGMEVLAATLEGSGPRAAYVGDFMKRRGNHGMALSGVYPCKDGYIGILAVARNWPAIIDLLGKPELSTDPRFTTSAKRRANDDALQAILYHWFMDRTKDEIFDIAGRTKAPVSPILTVAELFD
ncbi:MAG: CoA transferase, partial [SAR202 cluster bacterium]|nr:CoA transferase [SAR202 cluster bacterium]